MVRLKCSHKTLVSCELGDHDAKHLVAILEVKVKTLVQFLHDDLKLLLLLLAADFVPIAKSVFEFGVSWIQKNAAVLLFLKAELVHIHHTENLLRHGVPFWWQI